MKLIEETNSKEYQIELFKTHGISCIENSDLPEDEKRQIIKMISSFDGNNKKITFLNLLSWFRLGKDIWYLLEYFGLELPDK